MSNTKAVRIDPVISNKPYIKGTEVPNFYLITGENDEAIWGFRPLATAVPALGSSPTNGEATRFRVVPKNQDDAAAFGHVLSVLNFEKRKYSDDDDIHFSTVVSDAASFAAKLEILLGMAGCF